jgi:hypothetical protein
VVVQRAVDLGRVRELGHRIRESDARALAGAVEAIRAEAAAAHERGRKQGAVDAGAGGDRRQLDLAGVRAGLALAVNRRLVRRDHDRVTVGPRDELQEAAHCIAQDDAHPAARRDVGAGELHDHVGRRVRWHGQADAVAEALEAIEIDPRGGVRVLGYRLGLADAYQERERGEKGCETHDAWMSEFG